MGGPKGPCVVVYRPLPESPGYVEPLADLPSTATEKDILDALAKKAAPRPSRRSGRARVQSVGCAAILSVGQLFAARLTLIFVGPWDPSTLCS